MGDGIGERLHFPVRRFQLRGAPRHPRFQFPVEAAQRLFRLAPCGDVDLRRLDQPLALPGDRPGPVLHPDRRAVLAHTLDLVDFGNRLALQPGQAELPGPLVLVRCAQRQDGVQRKDLGGILVAEDAGQGLVGEHRLEVPVDVDALDRPLDQVAEPLLTLPERSLRPADFEENENSDRSPQNHHGRHQAEQENATSVVLAFAVRKELRRLVAGELDQPVHLFGHKGNVSSAPSLGYCCCLLGLSRPHQFDDLGTNGLPVGKRLARLLDPRFVAEEALQNHIDVLVDPLFSRIDAGNRELQVVGTPRQKNILHVPVHGDDIRVGFQHGIADCERMLEKFGGQLSQGSGHTVRSDPQADHQGDHQKKTACQEEFGCPSLCHQPDFPPRNTYRLGPE